MVLQGLVAEAGDKNTDLHFLQLTPDCRKQELPAHQALMSQASIRRTDVLACAIPRLVIMPVQTSRATASSPFGWGCKESGFEILLSDLTCTQASAVGIILKW